MQVPFGGIMFRPFNVLVMSASMPVSFTMGFLVYVQLQDHLYNPVGLTIVVSR